MVAANPQPTIDLRYERHKREAAERQRQISAAGREIGDLPPVFDPERKEACSRNLRLFLETYCAPAVRLGWSKDHLELIEALQDVLLHGGQLAVGMPRGTGKTTIVILSILWAIIYGHHRFIALIAATDPKAKKALAALRKQVETNTVLLEDFPEVCFPVRCLKGITNKQAGQTYQGINTSIQWGKEEIIFPTIEGSPASGALIVVGGITGAISRGPQHTLDTGEVLRPSVALIDDFQTRESAKSPQQVSDRLDIIEADIAGMAGPDQGIALLATVTVIYPDDGADQLLDVDKNPDWNGIRKKFLIRPPDNLELWEEYKEHRRQSLRTYRDIRLATQFYKDHREEMDKGAEVSWENRFRYQTKEVDGEEIETREISAIQHAMEWMLVKPAAFASEMQNEPLAGSNNAKGWLSAKEIENKTHGLKRERIPQLLHNSTRLVEHLDVHDDLLYWALGALTEEGSCALADYGTYPKQRSRYFQKADCRKTMRVAHKGIGVDGAIRASLLKHCKDHLDRTWKGEDGVEEFKLDLLLIDCGHKPEVVNSAVIELLKEPAYKGRVMLCRGFGVRASETPFAERRHPKGTKMGNHCYEPPKKTRLEAPRLNVDTNFWKTETQDRWATGFGEPGCLSLFKGGDHQGIAEHQTAEVASENLSKGRTVWEFRQLPRDNHWFDNVVNLLAGASYRGCDTPANVTPKPFVRKRKRKNKVSYL